MVESHTYAAKLFRTIRGAVGGNLVKDLDLALKLDEADGRIDDMITISSLRDFVSKLPFDTRAKILGNMPSSSGKEVYDLVLQEMDMSYVQSRVFFFENKKIGR